MYYFFLYELFAHKKALNQMIQGLFNIIPKTIHIRKQSPCQL